MALRRTTCALVVMLIGCQLARSDNSLPPGARTRFVIPASAGSQQFSCLTFSPDGKILALGGSDKRIHLFHTDSGRHIRSFGSHLNEVWTVAFSPDGRLLASGGRADFVVRMWDPATGSELKPCDGPHRGGITRVVFFRDASQLISAGGSWDPTIRVWDVGRREQVSELHGHADYIDSMDLARHGRLAASASRDGTLRIWSLRGGHELRRQTNGAGFASVALAPDGHSLATGNRNGEFQLWETISLQPRLAPYSDSAAIRALAFSADGRLVAAVGNSNHSFIKNVETDATHQVLSGHQASILGVAFSPNGRTVATCDSDGVAYLWSVKETPEGVRQSLDEKERLICWNTLRSNDAREAYGVIMRLTRDTGPADQFLGDRLKAALPADEQQFARWIASLDDKRFVERERGTHELARAGEPARESIVRALANVTTPEAKVRLKNLLIGLGDLPPDARQELRAIEVLDRRGGSEAVAILRRVAKGCPSARSTAAAQDALDRHREGK